MEGEKTRGWLKMLNYTGFHMIGRRDQGGPREKQRRREIAPLRQFNSSLSESREKWGIGVVKK